MYSPSGWDTAHDKYRSLDGCKRPYCLDSKDRSHRETNEIDLRLTGHIEQNREVSCHAVLPIPARVVRLLRGAMSPGVWGYDLAPGGGECVDDAFRDDDRVTMRIVHGTDSRDLRIWGERACRVVVTAACRALVEVANGAEHGASIVVEHGEHDAAATPWEPGGAGEFVWTRVVANSIDAEEFAVGEAAAP